MSEQPVLIMREGDLAGQSWTVTSDIFSIGRGGECDLTLPERQVSRTHVKILRDNGRYLLQDLGSKNGTHLNGKKVESITVPLFDGDEIQIALAVKLVFVGTDATVPLHFDPPVVTGNLLLDIDRRTVTVKDDYLDPPLSLAQFRLLQLLYEANGAVCSRDAIVDAVWPDTGGVGVTEQAIDALVRRLRERLADMDGYNYIITVRGHGFRMDNAPH